MGLYWEKKMVSAYAVRIAGLENPFGAVEWHRMAKAKNLDEFEAALKMLQYLCSMWFTLTRLATSYTFLMEMFRKGGRRLEHSGNGTIDGSYSKYIWNAYHSLC
jgi:acyl-homoserine-lactone acylase